MNCEQGMEIYFDFGVAYFEDMNVVNWIMNEMILEFLTFEFMSNNIELWLWSCFSTVMTSYNTLVSSQVQSL